MTETKKTILTKAESLFLRYGVKSVTMDDIARELVISKKTLYQFFDNKVDLLTQVAHTHTQRETEIINSFREKSKDAIEEMLRAAQYVTTELTRIMSPTLIFDLQKYYPEAWQIFETFQQEGIYRFIKANLERGINEGLYRSNIDADIVAKLYVSKTVCVVDEDSFPQTQYNKVNLFKQFFIYHIHGVATSKGLKRLEEKVQAFLGQQINAIHT